jgi:hypothetical protein
MKEVLGGGICKRVLLKKSVETAKSNYWALIRIGGPKERNIAKEMGTEYLYDCLARKQVPRSL